MCDASLLTSVLVLLAAVGGADPGAPRDASFERLRALAGSWTLIDPAGEPTDLRATYRVVAGGSAVLETLFAGTPQETVTIYHVEAARVTVTQLSARGTPARLVPAPSDETDTLRFTIDDRASRPGHLRALALTLLGAEHIRIEWELATTGGGAAPRAFELRRETPVAELNAEVARLRVDLEGLQRELDRRLKLEVKVGGKGAAPITLWETRTRPPGPGWNVSGEPFFELLYDRITPFASTFTSQGDRGMTVAHYGFRAGPGCKLEFSLIGGHGYVAVVEETKVPPRRIRSIPEFSEELGTGAFGQIIERLTGGRRNHPLAVTWDLSEFAGKSMRLYVVDAATDHWGQIGISEVRIVENAR